MNPRLPGHCAAKKKPEKAVIVNLSLEETREIEGTSVEFIPYHKLLFSSSITS